MSIAKKIGVAVIGVWAFNYFNQRLAKVAMEVDELDIAGDLDTDGGGYEEEDSHDDGAGVSGIDVRLYSADSVAVPSDSDIVDADSQAIKSDADDDTGVIAVTTDLNGIYTLHNAV